MVLFKGYLVCWMSWVHRIHFIWTCFLSIRLHLNVVMCLWAMCFSFYTLAYIPSFILCLYAFSFYAQSPVSTYMKPRLLSFPQTIFHCLPLLGILSLHNWIQVDLVSCDNMTLDWQHSQLSRNWHSSIMTYWKAWWKLSDLSTLSSTTQHETVLQCDIDVYIKTHGRSLDP